MARLVTQSSSRIEGRIPAIIGIPSCLGGNMTGCELGPQEIRRFLIPILKKDGISFTDLGNVEVPVECVITDPKEKCLTEIRKLYKNFEQSFQSNKIFEQKLGAKESVFPILLGGDHSVNFSYITRLASYQKIGLIWFDAHGDFNTPAITPSGNIHGMVLSAIAGRGLHKDFGIKEAKIHEKNICIIGARDLDPLEAKLLHRVGIRVFTITEIKKRGLENVMQEAIYLATNGTTGFHVSIDLDVFDPLITPGVGTPVTNGLTKKDATTITRFFKNQPITSLDVVEYNPSLDIKNKTATFAANLIVDFLPR